MTRLRISFFLLLAATLFTPALVVAQPPAMRVVPTDAYFNISIPRFNEGNFERALADFNNDFRHAVKVGDPDNQMQMLPWIDSMCYWTMIGECHYQMGRYEEAMTAFNQSAQIYLANFDWLMKIGFTGSPSPIAREEFPWGVSKRPGGAGNFERCKFNILQDSINIINLGQTGHGIIQQQTASSIRADEIITRMGLMMRRRAEILGPLSQHDKLTKDLSQVLGGRPCPPNHFTGVWVDVLYGLSLAALGDDKTAAINLDRGLLMEGRYDHQLTPVALFELGNISFRAGKLDEAMGLYLEASFSAFLARDAGLLSDIFRSMANVQKLIDRTKPTVPLHDALKYFANQRNVSPMIIATLCHEAAEDYFMLKNIEAASKNCTMAANAMNKRSIFDTVYGARNDYLSAMIAYAMGYAEYVKGKPLAAQMSTGDKYLNSALGFMQRGSLWLYQLTLLENYFQQGMITARGPITIRIADELYDYMLREPTAVDWAVQPMDCLAAMTFTPASAYERWFYVAMQRGDSEKAFNISELARRAKFYASFTQGMTTLGPRLISLRLLFEGRPEDISQEMLLERQTLTLDFAEFTKLSNKVRDLRRQLAMLPVIPRDPTQVERQKNLIRDLESVSLAQEAMLRPIALTRTRAPNAFPPVLTCEQIRKELPEQTAMLVFVESLGDIHGFFLDRRSIRPWTLVQNPRDPSLQKLITDFLDGLGNKDANRPLNVKDIIAPDAKWKAAGEKLLIRLLGNQRQDVNFTELVIVPTGPLWYVPFEAMTVKVKGELRPLIASGETPLTVRYAPMASLGVPRNAARSAVAETLVVHGRFFSKDESTVALNAVDRYVKDGVRKMALMPALTNDPNYRELPGSASAFATQVRQLVVLDDIPTPQSGLPLGWSPFTGDRAKINNPVASWLVLPWGGPQLLVLPGFHTPAENSLKAVRGAKTLPNGDELFLSAMALEACGANTILFSRWRVGGRSTYDLVGEFMKNYPNMSAAQAWRQAVLDVGVDPLIIAEEPRVRGLEGNEPPSANHPFFWSGFLLIDRGEKPGPTTQPAVEESKLD